MAADGDDDVEGIDWDDFEDVVVYDIAKYRMKAFVTWNAFLIKERTVWRSAQLWHMMMTLAAISMGVAWVVALLVPNPATLKVGKFTDVSKFLNVAVGLLMGFFLSSSMQRWFTCLDGFLQLLDAIRNLQLQFIGLGVPENEMGVCMRYGLLSGWLLYYSLLEDLESGSRRPQAQRLERMVMKISRHNLALHRKETGLSEEELRRRDLMSASMEVQGLHRAATWATFDQKNAFLTPSEMTALQKTHDPAAMMWVWVAGLIGRLAQDGYIPPMQSPTYGRIMDLCQQAHTGIREIVGSIKVQPPLIYTHLLATLVHANNLLNAITFGIVLGLSAGTCLQYFDVHPLWKGERDAGLQKESQRDVQTAIVTFMYCSFGPLIYQALLLIGVALAQPFDSQEASIPLERFLLQLEHDLRDGSMVANNLTCFDRPCFKEPLRKSAGIVSKLEE